jgi:hypothetical protein
VKVLSVKNPWAYYIIHRVDFGPKYGGYTIKDVENRTWYTGYFFFHKAGLKEIVPHTERPDKDNLEKAVMDALTGIQIWNDDCQVYGGNTEKYWTPGKSGARIWIEAEDANDKAGHERSERKTA